MFFEASKDILEKANEDLKQFTYILNSTDISWWNFFHKINVYILILNQKFNHFF